MNRKIIAATDVRWFGTSPRLLPHLFGREVALKSPQDILAPSKPDRPNRPRRPWLRILISHDPYMGDRYDDDTGEIPTDSMIDYFNWVDLYGEYYSFHEKKLIVAWSTLVKPSGRAELTFQPEENIWNFDQICEKFIHHACKLDSALDHTFQQVQEFHIRPHQKNPYTNGEQILLFVSGLWLVYNRQSSTLTEMVECPSNNWSNLPYLRPVYHDEMTFSDDFIREDSVKSSSEPTLPTYEEEISV